jgi:hypothetical protein
MEKSSRFISIDGNGADDCAQGIFRAPPHQVSSARALRFEPIPFQNEKVVDFDCPFRALEL